MYKAVLTALINDSSYHIFNCIELPVKVAIFHVSIQAPTLLTILNIIGEHVPRLKQDYCSITDRSILSCTQ